MQITRILAPMEPYSSCKLYLNHLVDTQITDRIQLYIYRLHCEHDNKGSQKYGGGRVQPVHTINTT